MQSTDVRQELAAKKHPRPATVPHATVPYRLNFERLNADHGAALFAVASIILADPAKAEDAVARLLSRICSRPLTTPGEGSRRQLSRRLYLNCTWSRLVSGHPPESDSPHEQSMDGFADTVAELGLLSEQQRAAIALFLYGDHNCQEVAELISLPSLVLFNLLRSGLEELRRSEAWSAKEHSL